MTNHEGPPPEAITHVHTKQISTLEKRFEKLHTKIHNVGNQIQADRMAVIDLRHAANEAIKGVEGLSPLIHENARAITKMTMAAQKDRDRQLSMKESVDSVAGALRTILIGSAITVLGAAVVGVGTIVFNTVSHTEGIGK